eukprot:3112932-Prorocentrum_lima.AAC.1
MFHRQTKEHTQRWDTDEEYRKRRASYGATRKEHFAFSTMPWEPETADEQPLPIRSEFLIRCKVLVLKLIAQYKIFGATIEHVGPISIDVPGEALNN